MNTLLKMLLLMVMLNVGMWLFQTAVTDANPDKAPAFFDVETSPISKYMNDGELNVSGDIIPDTEGGTSQTTGNWFTDTFLTLKNWVKNKLETPYNFVTNFLTAPNTFLKAIGVPKELATGFGIIWWILGVIVFIMFLRGMSD